MSKHMSLIVFLNWRCCVSDATDSGKRFLLLITQDAKQFLSSEDSHDVIGRLIDYLLTSGLLKNLKN